MKLLRFALLKFEPPLEGDWRDWHLASEGVHLQTEWVKEREAGSLTLFVVASVDLPERPVVNDAGLVVLPEGPLKQAEALIETSANLIAVSERCKRTINSPIPSLAFLPEDEET